MTVGQSIRDWYRKPFNAEGNALSWVLTVGLIVVALFLWQMVLLNIKTTE